MADYEKLTWLWCTTCLLSVLSSIQCQFVGESCLVENKQGICKLLRDCPQLLDEVKNAGSPMPLNIRRKLNTLTCGFENDEPAVCCNLQINFNKQVLDDETKQKTSKPNSKENNLTINKLDNEDVTKNKGPPDVSNHRNIDLLSTNCGLSDSDRIYGGNSTRLYEVPWMALLAYDSPRGVQLSCGGTVINERYVLTAAHCVSFLGNRLKLAYVVLGEHDVTTDPDCEMIAEDVVDCAPKVLNISIAKATAHPGYSPQNLYDDIALIRLSKRVNFSKANLKPICLPTIRDLQLEKLTGLTGEVAGWGATENGLQSSKLQSVKIPFLTNEDCEKAFRNNMSDRQICAGGDIGKDSCAGDSGGPLLRFGKTETVGVRQVQRGIVSIGSKHCGIGYPGIYTNVAYYMDWILDNIYE